MKKLQTKYTGILRLYAKLLLEKIEKINKNWCLPYFDENLCIPKDTIGKYHGITALMLLLDCEKKNYSMPIYIDQETIDILNKKEDKERIIEVKAGEKPFPIIEQRKKIVNMDSKKETHGEDPTINGEKYEIFWKSKTKHVYNIDQTNFKEARSGHYKFLAETPSQFFAKQKKELEKIDTMVDEQLWVCRIRPEHQDMSYYDIREDEIVIPTKGQFQDQYQYYSGLFHELAHSTGAEDRLTRFTQENGWGISNNFYAKEELVAELSAAFTAKFFRINKYIKDDSASYLQSWMNILMDEDTQAIEQLFRNIDHTIITMCTELGRVFKKIDANKEVEEERS